MCSGINRPAMRQSATPRPKLPVAFAQQVGSQWGSQRVAAKRSVSQRENTGRIGNQMPVAGSRTWKRSVSNCLATAVVKNFLPPLPVWLSGLVLLPDRVHELASMC